MVTIFRGTFCIIILIMIRRQWFGCFKVSHGHIKSKKKNKRSWMNNLMCSFFISKKFLCLCHYYGPFQQTNLIPYPNPLKDRMIFSFKRISQQCWLRLYLKCFKFLYRITCINMYKCYKICSSLENLGYGFVLLYLLNGWQYQ